MMSWWASYLDLLKTGETGNRLHVRNQQEPDKKSEVYLAELGESEGRSVEKHLMNKGKLMPRYIVKVDENEHFLDLDFRRVHGTFDTPESAIKAAKDLVDRSLCAVFKDGNSPEQLYSAYQDEGDDPFIETDTDGVSPPPFSGWGYAQARAAQMCGQ